MLFLGSMCNSNCIFCEQTRSSDTKSYEQLHAELSKMSGDLLRFTGGEPTIHKSFLKLLDEARRFKEVMVETNGYMLSYENFTSKLKGKVDRVQITFHSTDAGLYDKITGCKGSLARVNKALQNLKNEGIPLIINFVPHKHNYMEFESVVSHVRSMGARAILVSSMNPNPRVGRPDFEASALRFSEVMAPIIKTLSNLKEMMDIKLVNFPLCTMRNVPDWQSHIDPVILLRREQRQFIGCCNGCDMKQICPGIWSRYISLFGESEFSPILSNEMFARDYGFPKRFAGIYGFFAGFLCDIAGLEKGFKKVSVFNVNEPEKQKVIDFFADYHCSVGHELIVAKEKTDLENYLKAMHIGDIKKMGLLLGYPECCVDFFVNNFPYEGDQEEQPRLIALSKSKRIDYRLNNFISAVPRIISFCVCDYECKNAISFYENVHKYMVEEGMRSDKIVSSMKLPMLYVNKHSCICFESLRKSGDIYIYSAVNKSTAKISLLPERPIEIKEGYVIADGNRIDNGRIIEFS